MRSSIDRSDLPSRNAIVGGVAVLAVLAVAAALAAGVGGFGGSPPGVAVAEAVEDERNTSAAVTRANNLLAQRQQGGSSEQTASELEAPLRQSRADLTLSRELLATLNNASKPRRGATLDAAEMALAHRTRQARYGNLGGDHHGRDDVLVSALERKRTDLQLSRDLLAILNDSSRSPRAAIMAAAETSLESHRRQATEPGSFPATAAPFYARQADKIRTARTIVNESEDRRGSGNLARAVRSARTVQWSQAELRAEQASASESGAGPNHTNPSIAAFDLLDRHDVEAGPREAAAIHALNDLPEPTRGALTEYLDAYIAYERATAAAYADVDRTQLTRNWTQPSHTRPDLRTSGVTKTVVAHKIVRNETARESMRAAGVNVTRVLVARERLLAASTALDAALATTGPPDVEYGPHPVRVQGVLAIDLRAVGSTYTDNYALVVDGGGDDTYRNNAGGNNLADHPCDLNVTTERATAAALLDLGGDDVYATARGCGQRGGAQLGSGFLLDAGGNDTYTDRNRVRNETFVTGTNVKIRQTVAIGIGRLGTNGGGAQGGIAFLLDAGDGDDTYSAGWEGTNGGGFALSTGFLLDAGGNDNYTAGDWGTTGGGAQNAEGVLVDLGGNDAYTAGSGGTVGGGALEGEGFLLDTGGSDTYIALAYGMIGGSYGGGEGFVVDAGGSDTYHREVFVNDTVCRCFGPSFGIVGGSYGGGVGFLLDATGDDTYRTGFDGAAGGARGPPSDAVNVSSGFLFDGAGADTYKAKSGGTNGGASGRASGLLVDAGDGNDTYAAAGAGANGGGIIRGGGGGMDMNVVGSTNTRRSVGNASGAGAMTYGGFLLDTGGNDSYDNIKTNQGDGMNGGGSGFLLDAGGRDRYEATNGGDGNGGAAGSEVGFLLDAGRGNDTYVANSKGTNGGGAASGVGFLVDAGGSDTYNVDPGGNYDPVNGANGGGTMGGAGFLLDAAGDDTYRTEGNGTNGGANLGGIGFLLDRAGDDHYIAGNDGTNGGAAGSGSGLLVDGGGSDTYTAGAHGTNGDAASGVAVHLDVRGQDTYRTGGGASQRQGIGGIVDVLQAVWKIPIRALGF